MPKLVNLDALIQREDFEVDTEKEFSPVSNTISVRSLERGDFFYHALRKPDFQRETSEWDVSRVVGLVKTFIEGDLIPAVILWKNKEYLFVIDGSHRLSALIAWVHDDYGDGKISRDFFGNSIPEEQKLAAQKAREVINREIGSYEDHKKASENPGGHGPDIVHRARALGSRALYLQWVLGDAVKAENSFTRINQQAAKITPQELELINGRRKPNTIAARAIIRRGTGHQYWSAFEQKEQKIIRDIATELHALMFEPHLKYPIKSLDLPVGGSVYASPALRMVYDFINISVGVTSEDDDSNGMRTIEYLKRTKRVMQLLVSKEPCSVGLHPAIYFYSWTGKQQPILMLTLADIFVEFERDNKLKSFVKIRDGLEKFLVNNRTLLNQVVRKFGTKSSGTKHLKAYYLQVFKYLSDGIPWYEVPSRMMEIKEYSYLQPGEMPYERSSQDKYSSQEKSGIVISRLLASAPTCKICNGLIPFQSISIDHVVRRADGGLSVADNAQLTHPFCNTGYKESLHYDFSS